VKVLVTGGGGFLGRNVVGVLRQHGYDVVALSRRPVAEELGAGVADLRDQRSVAAAIAPLQVDAVCHLAALTSVRESFTEPLSYFDTNVSGTVNLLRALAGNPVPVVFASTNAVYGSARPGRLHEDMEPKPESPYAASKVAAEHLLAYQAATGAMGCTVLRCFNIAGPGDPDTTRIIPSSLRAAAGDIEHVPLNGDGSAVRDFVHVTDVAEAVRLALEATRPGRHQVFNVGTGEGASMAEVIRAAEKVTERPIPVVRRPPAREAHTLVADIGRIREVLGWRPTRSSIENIVHDAWQARS
jgi:UDP-glucose 4-epimerase